VVLFGVGTDFIVFLLFRMRERLRPGDESRAAVRFAARPLATRRPGTSPTGR
jgi:RND superfamily putative drug exporter